jgi:uncharacterized repeat protein (TIGR03803 family)
MRLTSLLPVFGFALLLLALNPRLVGQSAPQVIVLHNFTGGSDGSVPQSPLVQGSDGNFYGTASGAGDGGGGTVFQLTPAGGFTALHSFAPATEGEIPLAGLIQGSDGNFYGTTLGGPGSNGRGTVFQITPAGAVTTLHSFFAGSADGGWNDADLLQGSDGNFYGTTLSGGSSNDGTVYKVTPAGVVTTLHSFTRVGTDGSNPWEVALIQSTNGNFYGTTTYGGNRGAGTAFQMTPAGALTTLLNFPDATGGMAPFSGLVQGADGNFYGTAPVSGGSIGGAVFKITPAGTATNLHNFTGANGEGTGPYAGLIQGVDGNFYGTTTGAGSGIGTIFEVTPAGAFSTLYSFTTGTSSSGSNANFVIQGSDGNFYCTTNAGGSSGDGMIFVLQRNFGAPMVLVQPSSQIVAVGQAAVLTAFSSGATPLAYQWRLNGVNIAGATNSTLALLNLQQANSGSFSVVVSNGAGPAATSQESKLTVYAAPAGQQPAASTQTQTSQALSAAQTQAPRATANFQLKSLNSTAAIDPTKMTIVMTHGWNSSAAGWPASMGNAFKATLDAKANILAWDWSADAATSSVAFAASRGPNQGRALGQALIGALGAGYNLPIHFIGSGLGALVNCEAANYIHGDNRSKGDTTPTYSFWNNQMTLLDEAGDLVNSLLGKSDTVTNRWANAIPNRSAWVDNYVSQPGYLPSKAANVLLFRNSPAIANGYACSWYQETVSSQAGSMGDSLSFERGTLTPSQLAAPEDTYFLQSSDANASDQLTAQISKAPTWHYDLDGGAIIFPAAAYQQMYPPGALGQNFIPSTIQYSDNLAANVIQTVAPTTGAPVYLDSSGSTPAYVTSPGYPSQSANQAAYGMQLTMQPGAGNAVYAIIPMTIPNEAVGVTFEYQMTGAADADFMTMGVAAENDFTIEGAYSASGAWNGTPLIPVSSYHGQSTQLVFAMSGSNGPPSGTLSVRNIRFLIPPRPRLSLAMNGATMTVSWPVTATGWTLQTTVTLPDANSWQTVNGAPADTALSHTMTLNVASQSQFFRLMK